MMRVNSLFFYLMTLQSVFCFCMDSDFNTMFVYIKRGDFNKFSTLLDKHAKDASFLNKKRDGTTLLIEAILQGENIIASLLIDEKNVDVNLPDDDGMTPLMWAAYKGNEQIVEMLLDNPSLNVVFKDKSGKTAYDYANIPEIESLLAGRMGFVDAFARALSGLE